VCTKTCGGGVTARVRNISVEASNGGEECIGEKKETKECQTQQCPDLTTTSTTSSPTCAQHGEFCFSNGACCTGLVCHLPTCAGIGCIAQTLNLKFGTCAPK